MSSCRVTDDQHELNDLHARYVHAIDRGDFALLQSLYAPGATESHGEYEGDADGFIHWLRPILSYFEIATHTIANLLVRVEGDTAQSEARGTAFLRMKGPPSYNLIVVNRHFDTYRKVAGAWLFTSRAVCVDWAEQFAPSLSPLDLVRPFAQGSTTTDDPVYGKVPGLIRALRAGLPAGEAK